VIDRLVTVVGDQILLAHWMGNRQRQAEVKCPGNDVLHEYADLFWKIIKKDYL